MSTKSIGVILILLVIAIGIFELFWFENSGSPSKLVEIKTNPGTKVFAKLSGGNEEFLNSVSKSDADELSQIEVDVPINADVILRYDNSEEIIAYEKWQKKKTISVYFPVSVDVSAQQEAEVFIKLPDMDDFIKPRSEHYNIHHLDLEHANLTPITGGLKIPIGTKIKLVREGKERIFSYEDWKKVGRVWHDFLNP